MPDLQLAGCRPEPLAHYLKALGILRLVSEQADPEARGWWADDVFWLRTKLIREELATFFLEKYEPTPIVGPWGARSGFFPGSSESAARQALAEIQKSKKDRLRSFREVIEAVQNLLDRLRVKEKPETDQEKLRLMRACRAYLPDNVILFLDAAFVLTEEGKSYPPILGTGGNEGSGSYMSGYSQQVVTIIIKGEGENALQTALWGMPLPEATSRQTPGHFAPSAVGGANASTGFAGPVVTNPWDYLLLMEGVMVWSTAAARRLGTQTSSRLASPFTVLPSGAGYASATLSDSVKPAQAKREPFEVWLPLWKSPSKFEEIKALFSEGRVEIGKRQARNGVDFARAVASLGVARGIVQFSRHSFLMRNGQNFFAAPLGRWNVTQQPEIDLLKEIDVWFDCFRRVALGDRVPARMGQALRGIERAIMEYCQTGDAPRTGNILIALGEAEATLAQSPLQFRKKHFLKPIPLLSPKWLEAANDGSVEFRLAASLASVGLRENMEPVQVGAAWAGWLDADTHPRVVWGHGSLTDNLTAVLSRRCMDAQREQRKGLPLAGRYPTSLNDIHEFVVGNVDERRLEGLLRGLTLINWHLVQESAQRMDDHESPFPALYALLKLTHLSNPFRGISISYMPAILARAAAGEASEASRQAIRRLRGCGFIPAVKVISEPANVTRRIAGAVLFHISKQQEVSLAEGILSPKKLEHQVTV